MAGEVGRGEVPKEVRIQQEFGGALLEFGLKPKDNGPKFRDLLSSVDPNDSRSMALVGRSIGSAPEAFKAHLRSDPEFFALYAKLAAAELTAAEKAKFKWKLSELSESFENATPLGGDLQIDSNEGSEVGQGESQVEPVAEQVEEPAAEAVAEVAEKVPETIDDHTMRLNAIDMALSQNPAEIGQRLGDVEAGIYNVVAFLEKSTKSGSGQKPEASQVESLLSQIDWLVDNRAGLEPSVPPQQVAKFREVISLAEIVSNLVADKLAPVSKNDTLREAA